MCLAVTDITILSPSTIHLSMIKIRFSLQIVIPILMETLMKILLGIRKSQIGKYIVKPSVV
jgi:hypothetical protein